MDERVRLIKEKTPELPCGSIGTVIGGYMKHDGMVRVLWDCGFNIPMYCHEIEEVKEP